MAGGLPREELGGGSAAPGSHPPVTGGSSALTCFLLYPLTPEMTLRGHVVSSHVHHERQALSSPSPPHSQPAAPLRPSQASLFTSTFMATSQADSGRILPAPAAISHSACILHPRGGSTTSSAHAVPASDRLPAPQSRVQACRPSHRTRGHFIPRTPHVAAASASHVPNLYLVRDRPWTNTEGMGE